MLSRVADALFWMSRYLERAEHVTRLLDVWFHAELDLRAVAPSFVDTHWRSLATILQLPARPPQEGADLATTITQWLTFDLENPSSIMSCVSRARSNARSIRGTIHSGVWRELNKLYWQLCDPVFRRQALDSPNEFFRAVESGSHLFQGACDATLDHDEGWHFLQLGKLLERADKTLRILDVQFQTLHGFTDPIDLPLTTMQWAAVLRSCHAYEAYQRLYVGRVDAERAIEFLLLHPTYPRSVRFSFEAAAAALSGAGGGAGIGKADRILGRVIADLKFLEVDQIFGANLHPFLIDVLLRSAEVGRAIQEHYALQ